MFVTYQTSAAISVNLNVPSGMIDSLKYFKIRARRRDIPPRALLSTAILVDHRSICDFKPSRHIYISKTVLFGQLKNFAFNIPKRILFD